jgi:hypothetical protein
MASIALRPDVPPMVPTLRLAISLASMSPEVRMFVQTLLDVIEDDASLIASLKSANAELQEVVLLLAQDDGSMVRH